MERGCISPNNEAINPIPFFKAYAACDPGTGCHASWQAAGPGSVPGYFQYRC